MFVYFKAYTYVPELQGNTVQAALIAESYAIVANLGRLRFEAWLASLPAWKDSEYFPSQTQSPFLSNGAVEETSVQGESGELVWRPFSAGLGLHKMFHAH